MFRRLQDQRPTSIMSKKDSPCGCRCHYRADSHDGVKYPGRNITLRLDQSGPPAAPMRLAQGLPDFINLAKKLGPSVVNVSTTSVRGLRNAAGSSPRSNDPAEDFWQRFFGGQTPRGPQRQSGVGSGFIVDADGTILTNYHVVDGAQKLSVTLSDGKSYDAKVIGRDQKSDIAVIKIEAGRSFRRHNWATPTVLKSASG